VIERSRQPNAVHDGALSGRPLIRVIGECAKLQKGVRRMAYISTGTNEYGMPDVRIPPPLPAYRIGTLTLRPGDVCTRQLRGSLVIHSFFVDFDGWGRHSPGPGEKFGFERLENILPPGSLVRAVYPTRSWEETNQRREPADRIMGVPWWNMICYDTTDFIVGIRKPLM